MLYTPRTKWMHEAEQPRQTNTDLYRMHGFANGKRTLEMTRGLSKRVWIHATLQPVVVEGNFYEVSTR